jgi:hypothetical protein
VIQTGVELVVGAAAIQGAVPVDAVLVAAAVVGDAEVDPRDKGSIQDSWPAP